jgi:HAD superfamily hydrolase (TIGR01509 family)
VVFDFGGVLVDWRPRRLLERLYADPARRDRMFRAVLGHADWIELDRGTLREAESLAPFAARSGESIEVIAALMQAVRDSLQPKRDSIEVLRSLYRAGVPLYALSNISEENYQAIRARHECFSWFLGTVVSARVGKVKPDRDIYEYLCATHGLEATQCLFVDDMPANIKSAEALGFRTHLYTSADTLASALAECGLPIVST